MKQKEDELDLKWKCGNQNPTNVRDVRKKYRADTKEHIEHKTNNDRKKEKEENEMVK